MKYIWVGLIAGAMCSSVWAFDFRSVAEPTVMYDAPSQKATPLFVVRRDTPVEVIVTTADWVKVRDAVGDIVWVETKALAERRTVIVAASKAEIREHSNDIAAVVFEAEQNVVLDLVEAAPPGWAKVKHRDGQVGFVRVTQVWGL